MSDKQVTEKHNLSQDASALQLQLETDQLANRLKFHLGLEPEQIETDDGRQDTVWKEREYNLLNKRGVENVVGVIRGIVDKNQTTSIYDDKEIQRIMKSIHRAIARELMENWSTYGIEKRGTAEKVMNIATVNFYSALKRAKDGATLDSVTKTAETKSVTKQGGEEDRGGGFLGFGL